jgi:hypothetical protein
MAPAFPPSHEAADRCDLAGIARVVSVGRASAEAPSLVRLAFERVVTGAARTSDGLVLVRRRGGPAAWSDWWEYPVGARVLTHLVWREAEGAYATAWPGAVSVVEEDFCEVA